MHPGADWFINAAVPRAAVLGLFGAVGLSLAVFYSRRGPVIFPVYACLVAALALLLVRFPALPFGPRFTAVLVGFIVASAGLYAATSLVAARQRRELVRTKRLPASALGSPLGLGGHAWRVGALLGVASLVSAGVAFVVG